MLVLTRGQNEALCLKELGVRIKVLRLSGARVRLGIEAPRELTVVRDELAPIPADAHSTCSDCVFADPSVQDRIQQIIVQLLKANAELQTRTGQSVPDLLDQAQESLAELARSARKAESACVLQPNCIRGVLISGSGDDRSFFSGQKGKACTPMHVLSDQEQALCMMRNKGVDYVLINMDCPKLNGREMLKIIRSEPSFSRLRVYGMSNVSRSEAGVPLGPDGCDDWFLKPVNREVFLAAITTRSAG